MRQTLSQSRNTEVSLSVYPSTPFEFYGLSSTEGKVSLLMDELNRLRQEMAESSEHWNLEGLSASLKMLSAWTDDSIASLRAKESDPEHWGISLRTESVSEREDTRTYETEANSHMGIQEYTRQ